MAGWCATSLGCAAECTADSDCDRGHVCRDGFCVEPTEPVPTPTPGVCETNEDCDGDDLVCLDGVCTLTEEPGGCTDDAECGEGRVCVDGECRDEENTCQFSTECGEGRICVNERCTTGCTDDAECIEGQVCEEGYCIDEPPPVTPECVQNEDCDDGQICLDGTCFDACESGTVECAAGYYCYFGRCRPDDLPRPFCVDDSDCAMGAVCRNGVCRSPCSEHAECPRFDVTLTYCLEGLCATTNEATSDCMEASDCMGGQSCVDGICR